MESRAGVAGVAPDRVVDDPVLVDFVDGLTPGELLGVLAGMRPSALVLDALMTIDRAALSDVDAVAFLQVHQRVAAWWASVGLEAVIPAAAATWSADGKTSLVDWEALTWSLGCTGIPPSRARASAAITSLAFMFDDVPEPVWNTSTGNASSP